MMVEPAPVPVSLARLVTWDESPNFTDSSRASGAEVSAVAPGPSKQWLTIAATYLGSLCLAPELIIAFNPHGNLKRRVL